MCGLLRDLEGGVCPVCASDHQIAIEVERKRKALDVLNLRSMMEHGAAMGTAMGDAFYNGAREALVNGSEYGWH